MRTKARPQGGQRCVVNEDKNIRTSPRFVNTRNTRRGDYLYAYPLLGNAKLFYPSTYLYRPIPIFKPALVPFLKSFKPKSAYNAGSKLILSLR